MDEIEKIKHIAEQKKQKANDLMLDKEIQCLLYQGANANYWYYQIAAPEKDWSDKLRELLGYQSIRGYQEGWSFDKLDCIELKFPNYTFTLKFTSDFRKNSTDNNWYGNLYIFYDSDQVISFTLLGYLNMIDRVISIDNFIDGEWISDFKKLMKNVRLFVVWEKNKNEQKILKSEALEVEKAAIELKKKFGITEEDIIKTKNRGYETSFLFAKLITVVVRLLQGVIYMAITLLVIGLISGDL